MSGTNTILARINRILGSGYNLPPDLAFEEREARAGSARNRRNGTGAASLKRAARKRRNIAARSKKN